MFVVFTMASACDHSQITTGLLICVARGVSQLEQELLNTVVELLFAWSPCAHITNVVQHPAQAEQHCPHGREISLQSFSQDGNERSPKH
jgi:hypothetical protein